MRTIIKKGHVLNPADGMDGVFDVAIAEGVVTEIAPNIETAESDFVIDAEGKYVMPGFIDLHVHFREPGFEYKETIKTGSMSSAKGGYTSVCPMPNTSPSIDSKEMVAWLKEKEKSDSVVHIFPVGAVTKDSLVLRLRIVQGMKEAGASSR